jgi:hypothetical protein
MSVQKLNEAQKRQRFGGCKRLLEMPALAVNRIVFTDEKNLTLLAPTNSHNDRVYDEGKKKTIEPKRLLRQRAHFTKSVMVSAGVSVHGKTRLHFVDPGVKINANYYVNTLQKIDFFLTAAHCIPMAISSFNKIGRRKHFVSATRYISGIVSRWQSNGLSNMGDTRTKGLRRCRIV